MRSLYSPIGVILTITILSKETHFKLVFSNDGHLQSFEHLHRPISPNHYSNNDHLFNKER